MVEPESPGEVVAGAEGNDAQEAVRLGRQTSQNPDRAVATAGQHALSAGEGGTCGREAVGRSLGDMNVDGADGKRIAQLG